VFTLGVFLVEILGLSLFKINSKIIFTKPPPFKALHNNAYTYRIICRKVLHPEENMVCACPNRISSQKKAQSISPIEIQRDF